MPFPFACPQCGLETLVDDEYSGHCGPCAGCGKMVNVPLLAPTAPPRQPATFRDRSYRRSVVLIVLSSIAAASLVFTALVWLVFPALQGVSGSFYKLSCRGNMERIAMALRQYEIEHGSLPPAFVPNAAGKPMHSWRVLILPQLGEHGLHERYNFDEPWDSPGNMALANLMPDVYACPADPDARDKGETNYMVTVGPKTLFPGKTAVVSRQVTDLHAVTILIAESPVAGTLWTQPKDLDATRMKFIVNGAPSGEIGSLHYEGAYVVTLDGTVRFLSNLFPDDYLQAMSTANGNENVPEEVLDWE